MDEEKVKASPAIRRIAKQYGIDLGEIKGTGEDGTIEVGDLESYLLGRRRTPAAETAGEKEPEQTDASEEEYALYQEDAPVYSKLNYDDEDYITLDMTGGFDIELYPEDKYGEFVEASFEDPDQLVGDDTDAEEYIELDSEFSRSFGYAEPDEEDEEEYIRIADDVADELRHDLMDEAEDALESEAEETGEAENEEPEEDPDCCGDCEACDHPDDCPIEEAEDECGCGEHHHHHDEEEEECQPISISFRVPRENVDTLVYASGSDHDRLLMDVVIKALALAIYDEDNEFDGIINLVRFTREGIEVSTAVDALCRKTGYIEYQDPFDHEDVFVNVWDMTSFGFTSFTRSDAGMVNVFVSTDSKDIIIDSVSDEYTVAIDTCSFMMKSFKENLTLPAKMNERSVSPVPAGEEE